MMSKFKSVLSRAAWLASVGAVVLMLAGNDWRARGQAFSTDVVTHHNDNARTGQNLNETVLTLSNVNAGSFGKVGFLPVDGKVDAQPLYLSAVPIPGQGLYNVVYAATEHGSLYAFDADTGTLLWRTSLLGPGETPSDARNCGQVTPEIGITATPVIDRTRGPNGTIYAVAMSKNASNTYFQRLHAIDIATGAELPVSPQPIEALVAGTGAGSAAGSLSFDPKQYEERAALLLLDGVVYTTWTSHCDIPPYTGWILGHDAATLARLSVLNTTPNGSGGAFWHAGGGPAADPLGHIYLMAGNGTFDTTLDASGFPNRGNFGNAFLALSTSPTTAEGLAVSDYFATFDTLAQSAIDLDLGSGGPMVLPGLTDGSLQTRRLVVGAGKDRRIYVLDRDRMGKFEAGRNNVYQELGGVLAGGVFSVPSYFDNTVYFGAVGDAIKALPISGGRLASTPSSRTANTFVYPGATASISANGLRDAILWAVQNTSPAVLSAYDARNLARELYNSNQVPERDRFGAGNKFITPTIADGRVYVGTPTGVAVFGRLVEPPAPPVRRIR
jgi:outer membrane protein assembly factor BamB